jgi:carboxypeptidase Taq
MACAYQQLTARFARIGDLEAASAFLSWDEATMMPEGGAVARGQSLATLSGIVHELLTQGEMADLLARVKEDMPGLDAWQLANVREMQRRYDNAIALPTELVEAHTQAAVACEKLWRKAKAEADFSIVLPAFTQLLALTRTGADAKARQLGLSPYDALLDQYEPGLKEAYIAPLFEELGNFLPGFIRAVLAKQAQEPAPLPLMGPFPQAAQERLARELMAQVGFDFMHGRLDASAHPFCGGIPDDVRITTRYSEADFTRALMGVLHETGHALYERGLPALWRRQPVGQARGMAMHESQSLIIEMQAGRSQEFLLYLAQLVRQNFLTAQNPQEQGFEAHNILRLYRQVRPSMIRVDADEVTYPAHILVRWRLERALIAGEISPDMLPEVWRLEMKNLLGITPANDAEGCLQDIHWYCGLYGYFPTYSLGAMIAAQLYTKACEDAPQIPAGLKMGDFSLLLAWLRQHVHAQGSFTDTQNLLQAATGQALNVEIFKAHLHRRYLQAP